MHRWRITILACAIVITSTALAQVPDAIGKDKIMLFGVVTEEKGGGDLRNACVRVYTDSIAGDSVFTDAMGKYQLFVPLHGIHKLVYTMDGYHRKAVSIDASGEMSETARGQEWNLRIDIGLNKADIPLPEDLLDTPIGKAAWQPERGEFLWDQPYTERYKQRFKQAVKAAGKK